MTNHAIPRRAVLALMVVGSLGAVACSGEAKGGAARTGGTANVDSAGAGGRPGRGQAGQGAAGGGRTTPTITLTPNDVATVIPTNIEEGTALTGDLRPIETIDVRARIEGDLTGVLVREGQQVGAGQLLARFEAGEQESARSSAEADRAAAQSELSNAGWTLEQNTTLYKAGALAQQDLRNSQQQVAAARARLAAAQARLRASGNQARDTRVLAPASGTIEKRLVAGGEHVTRGTALFTLVRSGTLELAAAVPARNAIAVRVGQVVRFVADGRQFSGTVARVSPTVDPVTRAVTVYVQVPNPGGLLKGGTFATGRVVSRALTGVLAVPTAALRQMPETGRPFVYRIDGRTVNQVPVQLGAVDEKLGFAQVTEGLQAGEKVIVGNVGTLGRGMRVSITGEEKGRGRRASTP
ncbi:MAG: efflux RND transporter periplasmic adaptor subunit [Gemmatimonadaceae bacterium]|nr:efflux RND transporter periplasmic adaptor subunit [Gemmatimonadaceae bacterium]